MGSGVCGRAKNLAVLSTGHGSSPFLRRREILKKLPLQKRVAEFKSTLLKKGLRV